MDQNPSSTGPGDINYMSQFPMHCVFCHLDYYGEHVCQGYSTSNLPCPKYTPRNYGADFKYCPHCGYVLP